MKIRACFSTKPFRLVVVLPLFALWLWPAPLLADVALGIGLLGGALVGSLVGFNNNKTENTMIGAGVGGTPAHLSATPTPTAQPNAFYPANQPITAQPFYTTSDQIECRPMQTQGFVNGRLKTLVETACRTGTNTWQYQETPQVVQGAVAYQEPQNIFVEPAQTITVYPPPHTGWVAPPSMMPHPGEHTGRYYGHRDHWRERHNRQARW